ncbi:MAG: hypothetical protein A3I75_00875 [Deltaproteobacteria bacterium RIFCSPLOWO2_02_FULL_50_16]|nr:MAG: hypothetical protein A2053_04525 [Deltaproteobacteria bacterium GWA2_50_8]OGQ30500.1 MAG: hypothetical protein A3B79_02455 [Deltaproteobacteria bacterium RIFCSPHIGHO2_02_FULL_50_15]OGQ56378.1 MAG: hypothetical protein A3I75_00875 [Deltaproteobacteria bacterium RIFCSPLOWO2_02_FULL_50_16]OGQ67781.1 MAG: hypothetical protein A3F89_02120 [Deltaproteobacteria bacterium RIFCSPLOWO2_12_FULL_50_11]
MKQSWSHIFAMFMRYSYLHKRSIPRAFEIAFWPVMELLVWGFVSLYIQQVAHGALSKIIVFLINAMIFWDILYRSQQAIALSFVQDVWTQNIINILVTPLRIWEWIVAAFIYGFVKILIILIILSVLALGLYNFNLIETQGLYLIPMSLNLLLFGGSVGLITSSLILRWGLAAEALIWGVPFLLQPISAVFYPLSILPPWLQVIAMGLPSTYIFEGMRTIVKEGSLSLDYLLLPFFLNIFYFIVSALIFLWMYRQAQIHGRLSKLGMD